MKRLNLMISTTLIMIALLFQSCEKNEIDPNNQNKDILPERFKVDIPNSISSVSYYKDANVDTLQGNDIYEHMRNFIHIGEHAADIVGEIILAISWHHLNQPMFFSFTSDEDGRVKHVEIIENSEFEGTVWQYQMTISDEGTEMNTGKSNTAMQIFWNKAPIKGIAILNPYNIDRTVEPEMSQAMYRIDYSEAGDMGYEHHMIVTIGGLPVADPLENPYSVKTLKMFVGKNGDAVSVFGNSDHPNATFFSGEVGFDWAFVAAGKQSSDIGVAEVGLPSNTLNSNIRYTLLVENSIKNVFTDQIYALWPWIDSTTVQAYLFNADAPGFFNHGGFVQGGDSPGPQYNSLLNIIAGLSPYNPAEINILEVAFKE